MSFLGEIKRRKVFQVTAVYAVVSWLIVQIVDVVNDPLNLPAAFDTAVIVLVAIGFPLAVAPLPRGARPTGIPRLAGR